MSHAVLFTEFPLDRLEAVATAVGQVYQIPDFDVRARLHRGWGFLERDVPADRAEQVVRALAERGVGAVAIANADLRSPGDPQVMMGFEPGADGFVPRLRSPQAPALNVAWTEVAILAAGSFTEELIRRESGGPEKSGASQLIGLGLFLATGIPTRGLLGGRKQQAKEVKSKRLVTFGQIIIAGAESLCFNLDGFDFSGLGPQKQVNATLNFRALIAEFARRSGARLNLGARMVLENKSMSLANYQSTQDFETELRWMLNTTPAN